MRFGFIFLLILILGLASCSREDVVGEWDEEIEIPPSELLDISDINGIIRSIDGEIVSNAEIKLISDNEIIAETTSDQNGEFIFYDLIEDLEYSLFIQKSEFISSTVLLNNLEINTISNEFILLDNSFMQYADNELDPSSPDVAVVYGSIHREDGSEYTGLLYYSYNGATDQYVSYVHDSKFSFPVEKGSFVTAYTEGVCSGVNVLLDLEGPIEGNSYLQDLEIESTGISSSINILLIDCVTGLPVEDAYVNIFSIVSMDFIADADVVDGVLNLDLDGCDEDAFFVQVESDQIFEIFPIIDAPLDSFVIEVPVGCDSNPIFEDGEIELIINGTDSTELEHAYAIYDDYFGERFYVQACNEDGFLYFEIDLEDPVELDVYNVDFFQLWLGELDFIIDFPDQMSFELSDDTSFPTGAGTPGQLVGFLEGSYFTTTGSIDTIYAEIDIPIINW